MARTTGSKILAADAASVVAQIAACRTKYGLGTFTLATAVNTSIKSAQVDAMKVDLQAIITNRGWGATFNLNTVINYSVGTPAKGSLLQTLYDTATSVYNYCVCNCNYCSCNCDYCTCDCDYCSCDCDYCTCDCDDTCWGSDSS